MSVCLCVCGVNLKSGPLFRALSRLPQSYVFLISFTPQGDGRIYGLRCLCGRVVRANNAIGTHVTVDVTVDL